jgi:hypothetical protein
VAARRAGITKPSSNNSDRLAPVDAAEPDEPSLLAAVLIGMPTGNVNSRRRVRDRFLGHRPILSLDILLAGDKHCFSGAGEYFFRAGDHLGSVGASAERNNWLVGRSLLAQRRRAGSGSRLDALPGVSAGFAATSRPSHWQKPVTGLDRQNSSLLPDPTNPLER